MGSCNGGVALLCKHLSSHVVIFDNLFIINFILLSYVPSFLPISLCYQAMGSSDFVFQKERFQWRHRKDKHKGYIQQSKSTLQRTWSGYPKRGGGLGFLLMADFVACSGTPTPFICYVFGAVTTVFTPCLGEPVQISPCWKISHQYLSETHWGQCENHNVNDITANPGLLRGQCLSAQHMLQSQKVP